MEPFCALMKATLILVRQEDYRWNRFEADLRLLINDAVIYSDSAGLVFASETGQLGS